MMSTSRDLYEFLLEAELEHYFQNFRTNLKVTSVSQIKYVEDEDLLELGMSKPEMRRLRKFFKKECPQGAFGKIRKILGKPNIDAASPIKHEAETDSSNSMRGKHIIAKDSLTCCKTLGSGEFGTVQQGVWVNESGQRVQVAIKCLPKSRIEADVSDFLKEATLMHAIDHSHIVQLYGVVLEADNLQLVTELAPLRSLLECLHESAMKTNFPVLILALFSQQIAEGMAYLEAKRFIHRDLAARNILVFAKDKVKISDFGLSRALGVGKDYYQTNFSVNLKLPVAWCAPESINMLKFTSSSDVWAYAVTLWEVFSYGFQPWSAFTGSQTMKNGKCPSWGVANEILEALEEPHCQRLERTESCPVAYYQLMLRCWALNPERRPTFAEIVRLLPQIRPDQVQATVQSETARVELLQYKVNDVITILDKKPENFPGLWQGVLESGEIGHFDPSNTMPYLEVPSLSLSSSNVKVMRRESGRRSMRGVSRKLNSSMISKPQNDLRHTGHVGYDGAMFGDVAFIGDNYDKLPVKVVTPYQPHKDMLEADNPSSRLSISSYASSQDTLTDVSSFHSDGPCDDDNAVSSSFDDFKMPDLCSFDLGPSFMDEVMKALDSSSSPQADSTSPMSKSWTEKTMKHSESDITIKAEEEGPSLMASSLFEPSILVAPNSYENISFVQPPVLTSDAGLPSPSVANEEYVLVKGNNLPDQIANSCETESEKDCRDPKLNNSTNLSVTCNGNVPSTRPPVILPKPPRQLLDNQNGISLAGPLPRNKSPRPLSCSARPQSTPPAPPTKSPILSFPSSSISQTAKTPTANATSQLPTQREQDSIQDLPSSSPTTSVTRLTSTILLHQQEVEELHLNPPPSNSPREELFVAASPEPAVALEAQNGKSQPSPDASSSMSSSPTEKESRESRVRRALEHHSRMASEERRKYHNIRSPQGIPIRRPASMTSNEDEEVDSNPLRRLRDSQRAMVRPRFILPSSASESCVSRHGLAAPFASSDDESLTSSPATESDKRHSSSSEDVPSPRIPPLVLPKPVSRTIKLCKGSNDSVYSSSESNEPPSYFTMAMFNTNGKYSVSNVNETAAALGLGDDKDLFWSQEMNLEEFSASSGTEEDVDILNNHSYEDLLEIALDGSLHKRISSTSDSGESQEVRMIRRVMMKQVTIEDCILALDQTCWHVARSVKLLKLKQLLATKLANAQTCKEALRTHSWAVAISANHLLRQTISTDYVPE